MDLGTRHPAVVAPPNFRIIAHRGASAYAPESTVVAFCIAERLGAREIETDVRVSRDGKLILCHDDDLSRYGHGARGEISVESSDSADLLRLDIGSWFDPSFSDQRMVELDTLCARFGRSYSFNLEMCGTSAELPVKMYAMLKKYGLCDSCVVTSYEVDLLKVMRSVCPAIRLGWLLYEPIDESMEETAKNLGIFQICPDITTLTQNAVELAKEAWRVPEVRAWNLNAESISDTRNRIHKAISLDCNGATINWPDWLVNQTNESSIAGRPEICRATAT